MIESERVYQSDGWIHPLSSFRADIKFEMRSDFDAQQFFSECFGVIMGDGTKAEQIVLRVFGTQRHYINDLPLHHSQQLIAEGEDYADYTYYLRPTFDFCAHLFSLAGRVQVLQPQSLAEQICHMALKTLQRYESDNEYHWRYCRKPLVISPHKQLSF